MKLTIEDLKDILECHVRTNDLSDEQLKIREMILDEKADVKYPDGAIFKAKDGQIYDTILSHYDCYAIEGNYNENQTFGYCWVIDKWQDIHPDYDNEPVKINLKKRLGERIY